MTLAFYSSAIVQDALRSLDTLRANTETLMEEGVIRTVDGQAVQSADSLLRHLVRQAIENGTEVGVERAGHHDSGAAPPAASLRDREEPARSLDSPTLQLPRDKEEPEEEFLRETPPFIRWWGE